MTAARGGAALYTPELLGLAVALADYPFDAALSHSAEARSRTCGSSVAFACDVRNGGTIGRLGLQVKACAVGQAAAALFVQSAAGRARAEIYASRAAIAAWFKGGELPDWPGLTVLEPARAYPARHGAILLAWDAALAALSNPRG